MTWGAALFVLVPLLVALPWGFLYRRAQRLDAIAGLVVPTFASATVWTALAVVLSGSEIGSLIGVHWLKAVIPHAVICALTVFVVRIWFRTKNA